MNQILSFKCETEILNTINISHKTNYVLNLKETYKMYKNHSVKNGFESLHYIKILKNVIYNCCRIADIGIVKTKP
jgi:hypothetical protein